MAHLESEQISLIRPGSLRDVPLLVLSFIQAVTSSKGRFSVGLSLSGTYFKVEDHHLLSNVGLLSVTNFSFNSKHFHLLVHLCG